MPPSRLSTRRAVTLAAVLILAILAVLALFGMVTHITPFGWLALGSLGLVTVIVFAASGIREDTSTDD